MWFSCFPILTGSAEAQVIWGGIVKRPLIAYFIGNISAKKYQNPFRCTKVIASQRWDVFFETRCIFGCAAMTLASAHILVCSVFVIYQLFDARFASNFSQMSRICWSKPLDYKPQTQHGTFYVHTAQMHLNPLLLTRKYCLITVSLRGSNVLYL